MDLQHNKELIVSTLKSRNTQAFSAQELSGITHIPLSTLRGILKHLVHDGTIHKTTMMGSGWNKRKTEKIDYPQVWYHFDDVPQVQPAPQ